MADNVICAYCGAEMNRCEYLEPLCYVCPACGAESPSEFRHLGETTDACWERARDAAIPKPRILTMDEIQRSIFVTPVFLQVKEKIGKFRGCTPEILDKAQKGYFGKMQATRNKEVTYLPPEGYGVTWRCWTDMPQDEQYNTPWEVR